MADIFISYARADLPRTRQVVHGLVECGWSVFWDRELLPGKSYRRTIEHELKQARCVMVLWSRESVQSESVIDEAESGKQNGCLVSVRIEDVEMPLGFRQVQAATLIGWSGNVQDAEFQLLNRRLRSLILGEKSTAALTPNAPDRPTSAQRFRSALGPVIVPPSPSTPTVSEEWSATVPSDGTTLFLCYRRADTQSDAGRLHDRLSTHFGADAIFMDVDNIPPGFDFVEAIEQAVKRCDVFVVMIGKKWLAPVDEKGTRRIDSEDDFVRKELAIALSSGIPVLPVLVQGSQMPDASALPEDVRRLARRQAIEISFNRWHADVERLIGAVGGLRRGHRAKSGPV